MPKVLAILVGCALCGAASWGWTADSPFVTEPPGLNPVPAAPVPAPPLGIGIPLDQQPGHGSSAAVTDPSSCDHEFCDQCGRCHRCGINRSGAYAGCTCHGSYKFPVPPQYTYHWPGMYAQKTMTEYNSPYRFPALKSPETAFHQEKEEEEPADPNVAAEAKPKGLSLGDHTSSALRRYSTGSPAGATSEPKKLPGLDGTLNTSGSLYQRMAPSQTYKQYHGIP